MKAPRLAKLVMLMEDEDDIARLVTHHLNSGGFRTHCPERAAESDSRRRERSASAFHPGPYAPRSGRIPTLPQYQGTSESERYSDSDPYGKNCSRGPKTGDGERRRCLYHQALQTVCLDSSCANAFRPRLFRKSLISVVGLVGCSTTDGDH